MANRPAKPKTGKTPRLTLRIDFDDLGALGPGKVRLLERIDDLGSISAAGRSMDMSYRRAWLLVDSLNGMFAEAVVATRHGGSGGGKALLTPFGRLVVDSYRSMEREAADAVVRQLASLQRALAKPK